MVRRGGRDDRRRRATRRGRPRASLQEPRVPFGPGRPGPRVHHGGERRPAQAQGRGARSGSADPCPSSTGAPGTSEADGRSDLVHPASHARTLGRPYPKTPGTGGPRTTPTLPEEPKVGRPWGGRSPRDWADTLLGPQDVWGLFTLDAHASPQGVSDDPDSDTPWSRPSRPRRGA